MEQAAGIEIDLKELEKLVKFFPSNVVDMLLESIGLELSTNMVKEAPVDHGRLSGNIGNPIKIEDLVWGIPIDVLYWKPVQFGRREIVPVNAKALRFEVQGKVVFATYAKAVPPNPFITRAVEKTEPKIPELVEMVLRKFDLQ